MRDVHLRNPAWLTDRLIADNGPSGAEPLWCAWLQLPRDRLATEALRAFDAAGATRVTRLVDTSFLVEFESARVRRIAVAAVTLGAVPAGAGLSSGGRGRLAPAVLVAEGDDLLRASYARWLRAEGYVVHEAEDGLAALGLVRAERASLVVINLELPGLDGWETTRIVRRDPGLQDVRLVAVTGHATKTREQDARSAGCDASVAGPVRRDTLLATVQRVLGAR